MCEQAIPQPPYKAPGTNNWFSTPIYPENNADAVQVGLKQAANNQLSYPAKGWPTYEQGVTPAKSRLSGLHVPVTDWKAGDPTPAWQPLAGGRGFGIPSATASNSTAVAAGPIGGGRNMTLVWGNATSSNQNSTASKCRRRQRAVKFF